MAEILSHSSRAEIHVVRIPFTHCFRSYVQFHMLFKSMICLSIWRCILAPILNSHFNGTSCVNSRSMRSCYFSKKAVRQRFQVCNQSRTTRLRRYFEKVLRACANLNKTRSETYNSDIFALCGHKRSVIDSSI
jgi:hypothetical protein